MNKTIIWPVESIQMQPHIQNVKPFLAARLYKLHILYKIFFSEQHMIAKGILRQATQAAGGECTVNHNKVFLLCGIILHAQIRVRSTVPKHNSVETEIGLAVPNLRIFEHFEFC